VACAETVQQHHDNYDLINPRENILFFALLLALTTPPEIPVILQDLLMASFVRGVISRVRPSTYYLSRSLGFQIDGPNINATKTTGRTYTYDIYDSTRRIQNARHPSSPAGTISLNPVGTNTVTLGTFKEKIGLDYGQLLQIRKLGEGASSQDRMGATYISKQVATLRERCDNLREFLAGVLFRGGKYGFFISGDDFVPTYDYANAQIVVDLKIYSENLLIGDSFAAGLQMGSGSNIVTATWATAATDIPLQLDGIDSAFQDIYGAPLRRITCGSDVWNNVINNDKIRQIAGTSNISADFSQTDDVGPDGTKSGAIICRLKARPWLEWYVWNGSLSVAATNATTFSNVKLLPRGYATFMADGFVENSIKLVEGSEIIKDNDAAPPVERVGFYAYAQEKADPARVWYHTHQVVGVELNTPKAIATARVQ